MTLINNFDWQNFVFTSGANYLAASTSWINAPAGVGYPAALAISITVDYITVSSNQIGLTLIPNTATSVNFKVYKVLSVGAAGSRVFTVREEWNSANPVPISGGGTGAATVNGAIANLGLGDVANMTDVRKLIDAAFPVGVPIPYPLAAIPETAMGVVFFKLNGGTFSTTTYPKLALKYPTGVLPDMRGEFIRGWDDSRGVDTLRTLLSAQASTSIRTAAMDYSGNDAAYTNSFVGTAHADSDSATKAQPTTAKSPNNSAMTGSVSDNVMVATQNNAGLGSDSAVWITGRPRNIAFNYIVRAA
ncbi:phage tail protein [Yersinia alsatica]|uniref:phage tail protein n=1 Tax=Yersinia alsatica TaxID=2890317 RepID=UPI0032EFF711